MPVINEQQFLEIYDKNVGKIYRYIYFRVGSEEMAQDLTSEVFLKSWQHLQKNGITDSQSVDEIQLNNPRAFLYQVARNLITDYYRKKDKEPLSLEEITDRTISDKEESQVEKTAKNIEFEAVKKALSYLSDDYQEIIIWRYLDELEIREIAEIMRKPEGTVRTLLSRALGRLKEVLK